MGAPWGVKPFQHLEHVGQSTHFELEFSVNAIVSVRRQVMEQQGEKVQRLELLKKCFTRAAGCNAQAAESCFGEVAHEKP